MEDRQKDLLEVIVSSYIKTAVPVGSKLISQIGNFDLSPATIRNEMAELENQGYIFQPHTSAGRIPTQKAYEVFTQDLKPKDVTKKQKTFLENVAEISRQNDLVVSKQIAKGVSEISTSTVFVATSPSNLFYTGISNLFSQPEFVAHHELVYNLSKVIDHMDQVVAEIFEKVNQEVAVLIGDKNPFGSDCSSILVKVGSEKEESLFGILGPMRMDYQNNLNLINYSKDIINKF